MLCHSTATVYTSVSYQYAEKNYLIDPSVSLGTFLQ